MTQHRIAVLITSHNRKANTIGCLQKLMAQTVDSGIEFKVYLVDDGSTDGTAEAVNARFPSVRILKGDGNLFWCGGMRMAFAEALKSGYDYYLWLNDDTILFPDALTELLNTSLSIKKKTGSDIITVGSVCSSEQSQLTWGSTTESTRWWPAENPSSSPNTPTCACRAAS